MTAIEVSVQAFISDFVEDAYEFVDIDTSVWQLLLDVLDRMGSFSWEGECGSRTKFSLDSIEAVRLADALLDLLDDVAIFQTTPSCGIYYEDGEPHAIVEAKCKDPSFMRDMFGDMFPNARDEDLIPVHIDNITIDGKLSDLPLIYLASGSHRFSPFDILSQQRYKIKELAEFLSVSGVKGLPMKRYTWAKHLTLDGEPWIQM